MTPLSTPFFVRLQDRGLIHIEGGDRKDFLQGLVTNDIRKLEPGKILYACLLTPQGKFLHDFFIHEGEDFLLLDCEGGHRAQDLYDRLNRYRMRADVRISMEKEQAVYAISGPRTSGTSLPDPRHPSLGLRSFEKPDNFEEKPFAKWDILRITLVVPDGSRDMEEERSTLPECNIDKLNGVARDKGCYVGQEVTTRMHHRGLVKKHLYAVRFDGAAPPPFTDIEVNGRTAGNMRSSCGDIGLALLKDDTLKELDYDSSPIRLLG